MTAAAGTIALFLALASALSAAALSGTGAKRRDQRWVRAGERALASMAIMLFLACALLVFALLTRDFSNTYVASYVSRSTPWIYSLTALWAGMEGSLLLWTFLTGAFGAAAALSQKGRRPELVSIACVSTALICTFFISVLVFAAQPFETIFPAPADGQGLNPLLQSPFMAIHPLLLYLGLTGFAVPFSFAIAALISGRLDTGWLTSTRRWTVLSWSFLSIGILLGAAWAYMELGWGGYWAWDPVENASLLPWLTATAFLHSVLVQERRGMLKIWNVALIFGTYNLAIFGTFLTRSGLLSSVHTFSESPVGKSLLPLLGILLVGSFGVMAWRLDKLKSRNQLESLLSRETMFLFNNVFFVAIAFTVLWGTVYPVFVEAFTGEQVSVGPPFFNSVVVPLGLALLALTGIGPLVAWRRMRPRAFRRQLVLPVAIGAITGGVLVTAGMRSAGAVTALSLCTLVAAATVRELYAGARAHKGTGGLIGGLIALFSRNRRRYGGYLVHLGFVLVVLGLAGAPFEQTWTGELRPGQSFELKSYRLTYVGPVSYTTPERIVNGATLVVRKNGKRVGTENPQRNFHIAQRQAQSEIALRTTLSEDLYIVMTGLTEDGATFKAWVNPLVIWIWIGGAVMAAGMVVILSGKPARRFESQAAPAVQTEKELVQV